MFFLKDFTKEIMFPVTLGERDNDTNTDHAGVITSTCTKDMNKGHSLQQDFLLNCYLTAFMSVLYPQKKVFKIYCERDKKPVFDQPEMKPLHHVSKHIEHCFASPPSVK